MIPIIVKQNDRAPEVAIQVTDGAGNPVDVTTATAIRFHMKNRWTGVVKVNAEAGIVNGLTGDIKYVWAAADLNTPGYYVAEFQITFPGGQTLTVPNAENIEITVLPDIV